MNFEKGGGRIIKKNLPIELNDLQSENICWSRMIVWSSATFILRWSCQSTLATPTRCVRRGFSLFTGLLAWVELTQMYTWPRVSCALYSKSGVSNMIVHIMTFEEHTYTYTREFLGVCMRTIDTKYIFTWPCVPYVSFQALVPYVHIFRKIPLPAFLWNKIRYVTQALLA